MDNIEYTKRLEEILISILHDCDTEPDEITKYVVIDQNEFCHKAITAIQQLNNEAMPQKKDATDGKDYFYSPKVKIAVANYNQAIDELRAVIGATQ
jgi:hypothetical protein